MPYKPDGSDVPENIKARSAVKRRAWAQVWNSAFAKCEDENGDDCEGRAFAQANAVIQQETVEKEVSMAGKAKEKELPPEVEEANAANAPVEGSDPGVEIETAPLEDAPPQAAPEAETEPTPEEAAPVVAPVNPTPAPPPVPVIEGGVQSAIEHLKAALAALEMPEAPDEPEGAEAPEETETAETFAESATPIIRLMEATVPTNRRLPLDLEVGIIKVGAGNARDNHYYTRELLERDGHVFTGLTMHTVDHREDQRRETTDVSVIEKVVGVREMPDGAYLVGRVKAYDPDFCEKTRNRAEAGHLGKLQCSILAKGSAKPGKVGETEYNIVQNITEGQFVDWVTRAGAGGHALQLTESAAEPDPEPEAAPLVEDAPQVVTLSEDRGDPQTVTEEVILPLAVAEVLAELGQTNLPASSVAELAIASYTDKQALQAAVTAEVTRLKAAGSGQPLGITTPATKRQSPQAIQQALQAVNRKWTGG